MAPTNGEQIRQVRTPPSHRIRVFCALRCRVVSWWSPQPQTRASESFGWRLEMDSPTVASRRPLMLAFFAKSCGETGARGSVTGTADPTTAVPTPVRCPGKLRDFGETPFRVVGFVGRAVKADRLRQISFWVRGGCRVITGFPSLETGIIYSALKAAARWAWKVTSAPLDFLSELLEVSHTSQR